MSLSSKLWGIKSNVAFVGACPRGWSIACKMVKLMYLWTSPSPAEAACCEAPQEAGCEAPLPSFLDLLPFFSCHIYNQAHAIIFQKSSCW